MCCDFLIGMAKKYPIYCESFNFTAGEIWLLSARLGTNYYAVILSLPLRGVKYMHVIHVQLMICN